MRMVVGVAAALVMVATAPMVLLVADEPAARLAVAAVVVAGGAVVWRRLQARRPWPAGELGHAVREWTVAAVISAVTGGALATLATGGTVAVVTGDVGLAVKAAARAPADGFWWGLTVMVAVPLTWALRRPLPSIAESWCERRAVAVTSTSVALVRHDLWRARSFRTFGAIVGWVVGNAPGSAYNHVVELRGVASAEAEALLAAATAGTGSAGRGVLLNPLVLALLGYAVGVIIAEVTRRSLRAPGGRGARLETRRSNAYTASLARWLPGTGAALAVLALSLRALLGDVEADSGAGTPAITDLAVGAALATVVAAAAAGIRGWVIRRPQRMVEPDRVAIDDAFRASAVHGIAGAASALSLLVAFSALDGVIRAGGWDGPLWAFARFLVGLGGFTLALGVWLGFGTSYDWTVRRGEPTDGRAGEPVA